LQGNIIWVGLSPRHDERGSASLYWGFGGIAPSGVQGQSRWWSQGGEAPEADEISAMETQFSTKILQLVKFFFARQHIDARF